MNRPAKHTLAVLSSQSHYSGKESGAPEESRGVDERIEDFAFPSTGCVSGDDERIQHSCHAERGPSESFEPASRACSHDNPEKDTACGGSDSEPEHSVHKVWSLMVGVCEGRTMHCRVCGYPCKVYGRP